MTALSWQLADTALSSPNLIYFPQSPISPDTAVPHRPGLHKPLVQFDQSNSHDFASPNLADLYVRSGAVSLINIMNVI